MISQEFTQEMKSKLLEAKAKLEEELSGLSAHEEMGEDQSENSMEIERDEASQDTMGRIKADLQKIETALMKIEEGTYGTDDEGKEISEERLRVLPWADKAL